MSNKILSFTQDSLAEALDNVRCLSDLGPELIAEQVFADIAEQPDPWTPSSGDYDRSIHCNPDAKAWADFFVATFPALADKHDLMLGWFANAMMAMHDWMKAQPTEQPDVAGMPLLHWYAMSFRDSGPNGEPVTASTNIGWPDQLITLPRIQEAKKGALVGQNAVMLACSYLGHATRSQILGKEGEA